MSDDQPGGRLGLSTIALADKATFFPALTNLAQPISDYSFANVFIWSAALKLYWTRIDRHVCVFANGTGDLTLLLPPLPEPGATSDDLARCIVQSFDIIDDYNRKHSDVSHSRIEYVSDEMLERISAATGSPISLSATVMSGDYIYPVANMIDLPGGALKSKRHSRSRFLREYPDHRVEIMNDSHAPACLELLERWRDHADNTHEGQVSEDESHVATNVLRNRETAACRLAIQRRADLKLTGMVVYVGDTLAGFTLGEALSPAQASILIEKTDPRFHGVPQFIFSEFCRRCWADYPQINVGDDWGIPTLRFTKESYRPSRRLSKYMLARPNAARLMVSPRLAMPAINVPMPAQAEIPVPADAIVPVPPPAPPAVNTAVRTARASDVDELYAIERLSFNNEDAFSPRQVRGLVTNEHVISRVAELDNKVAGWCVALIRRHRHHRSGRLYNIAVDPNCRGKGIGAALVNNVIQQLRQAGVRHVYLEVRADNTGAIRLYERLGFQCVRHLPDYYNFGSHGMSMRLAIPAPVESPVPVQ